MTRYAQESYPFSPTLIFWRSHEPVTGFEACACPHYLPLYVSRATQRLIHLLLLGHMLGTSYHVSPFATITDR